MANGLPKDYTPEYLGQRKSDPIDQVELIPWDGGAIVVELTCDEFTSLCPVTGQPDFGTLAISYGPGEALIESKSLKLYLLKFRSQGIFSETLVDQITEELWQQAAPRWIRVEGSFNSRGGIGIEVEASRGKHD